MNLISILGQMSLLGILDGSNEPDQTFSAVAMQVGNQAVAQQVFTPGANVGEVVPV